MVDYVGFRYLNISMPRALYFILKAVYTDSYLWREDIMAENNNVQGGFAIRCPHCGNWDPHKEDPSTVSVDPSHVETVMQKFQEAVEGGTTSTFPYKENKMFRCISPRWACPASYEAFIFDNEKKAQDALKNITGKWAISRDFRLYKASKKERWDNESERQRYFCIMFGTEPVPRQRDIELEHLVSPMLLKKIIISINSELEVPFTIYSGNILSGEKEDKLFWMPIEAYSDDTKLLPSEFNILCKICRDIANKNVRKEFDATFKNEEKAEDDKNKICMNNCTYQEYKKYCSEIRACENNPPDLNHCPLYIDKRSEMCFCYNSDKEMIDSVLDKVERAQDMWHREELVVEDKCPLGFTEIALPIIVHEHLVGIAMSGQVFFDMNEVKSIDDFFKQIRLYSKRNPSVLDESRAVLEMKRQVLFDNEKCLDMHDKETRNVAKEKRRFYLTIPEWPGRIRVLDDSIRDIEKMAEGKYRDIRSRSENAFRDELTGYTQHMVVKQMKGEIKSFFDSDTENSPILHILQRMRTFWAFNAAGYLWWDHTSEQINMVSYSARQKGGIFKKATEFNKTYGFPGRVINTADYKEFQEHPITWLWDPKHMSGQKLPDNEVLREIFLLIRDSQEGKDMNLSEEACYFVVMVPYIENIYGFVFVDRDEKNVSRTPPHKSLTVSELCQEFILRTCTEMVYELCNVINREQQRPPNGVELGLRDI